MNRRVSAYLRALRQHLEDAEIAPGQVHHVEVRHDDACDIWDGGPCDCEPDIESGSRVDRKYSGDSDPEEGDAP